MFKYMIMFLSIIFDSKYPFKIEDTHFTGTFLRICQYNVLRVVIFTTHLFGLLILYLRCISYVRHVFVRDFKS